MYRIYQIYLLTDISCEKLKISNAVFFKLIIVRQQSIILLNCLFNYKLGGRHINIAIKIYSINWLTSNFT